jgi:hypothetical protein
LIERSSLKPALKQELHELRKFRNRWVHVSEPWDHDDLLNDPESTRPRSKPWRGAQFVR